MYMVKGALFARNKDRAKGSFDKAYCKIVFIKVGMRGGGKPGVIVRQLCAIPSK